MLKGITVTLRQKTVIGTDRFNNPIYGVEEYQVDDVLIGEPSTDEITSSIQTNGKKLAYTLAIPKGDDHEWKDAEVEFFGERFYTFGEPTQGIESMIPLRWNKKVKVARYDAEDSV